MGKLFRQRLYGPRVYGCATCGVHLARHTQIIAKVCVLLIDSSRLVGWCCARSPRTATAPRERVLRVAPGLFSP